jgi:hypothetical protein
MDAFDAWLWSRHEHLKRGRRALPLNRSLRGVAGFGYATRRPSRSSPSPCVAPPTLRPHRALGRTWTEVEGVVPSASSQQYLRHNNQYVTGSKNELVRRCADGERHGALPKCPGCCSKRNVGWKRANVVKEENGTFKCNGVWKETGRKFCGWSDDTVRAADRRTARTLLDRTAPPDVD